MRFVEPEYNIIEQRFPDESLPRDEYLKAYMQMMYEHIELCGRTCYKSTDKITEDSAKPFVDRMIASKHYAMLEHGTVYLKFLPGLTAQLSDPDFIKRYMDNSYSLVEYKLNGIIVECYIVTNYRVIVENGWERDLKYLCNPTEHTEHRYTVRYQTNIQVYKEYTRHRVFSWAIESTRYCNYLKDKFGGCLTFINPLWLADSKWYQKLAFKTSLWVAEKMYLFLIRTGWKAQEAASLLPQATKAEVIMTGLSSDYKHFFDLRALGTTGAPHPQAKQLALPLYNEFLKRGYLNPKK